MSFLSRVYLIPPFAKYLSLGRFLQSLPVWLSDDQRSTEYLTMENAGDYRLGLNFLPDDPEAAKQMKLKELKNGRLAMLAFGGAITQAAITGNDFPWLFSAEATLAHCQPTICLL